MPLFTLYVGCSSHTGGRADSGLDVASGTGGSPGSGGSTGGTGATVGPGLVCLIDAIQYPNGASNPANPCQVCDAQIDASDWTGRDGTACDDGIYCNGADLCKGGACVQHAGDPCTDDGVFCNGVERCDEQARRCVSTGDPCASEGYLCGSLCNESLHQCRDAANDCGTSLCGLSPSGCFTCGQCGADQSCSRGRCGCTPHVGGALSSSPPPVPSGMKVTCLADPNLADWAAECPIIRCGGLTYWAFSFIDNSNSLGLVGYDAGQTAVLNTKLDGTRYLYKIEVDTEAQTVILTGESNRRIVMPWIYLWP